LTLREEPGLRVFKNRVWRIFGSMGMKQYIGSWRKLHMRKSITCTPCQIYYNNQIKEDEMDKACSTNVRHAYRVLVRKPEEKKTTRKT
jgi:hypothetical protein